jgi:hypothetical protein
MIRKAQRHDGGAGPSATALEPRPETSPAPTNEGDASTTAKQDVVLLGPPTADGGGVHVLRARNERVEAGELRPVQEGRPLVGELVNLRPRADAPRLCDVTESWDPKDAAARGALDAQGAHKGPARVATNAYRDGWEHVFAKAPGESAEKVDVPREPDPRTLN